MQWIALALAALVALLQAFLFFVLHGLRESIKNDRDAANLRHNQIETATATRIAGVETRLADAREHMVPRKEYREELAAFFARQDAREENARNQREEMLRQMADTTAQVGLVVQRAEYMEKQAEAMVEEVAEINNIAQSLNMRLQQFPMPSLPLPNSRNGG